MVIYPFNFFFLFMVSQRTSIFRILIFLLNNIFRNYSCIISTFPQLIGLWLGKLLRSLVHYHVRDWSISLRPPNNFPMINTGGNCNKPLVSSIVLVSMIDGKGSSWVVSSHLCSYYKFFIICIHIGRAINLAIFFHKKVTLFILPSHFTKHLI